MSDGYAAYGTLLKIGDGAGTAEAFTTIAEVGDIDGPSMSVNTIDMTSHSSPGARMEFLAGLIDSGEISFPINFIPDDATHDATTGIQKIMNDRDVWNWQMVFPDATTVTFAALVTAFGVKAPVAGKLSADVTFKISGQWTWS
jgi:predicted secreted protein